MVLPFHQSINSSLSNRVADLQLVRKTLQWSMALLNPALNARCFMLELLLHSQTRLFVVVVFAMTPKSPPQLTTIQGTQGANFLQTGESKNGVTCPRCCPISLPIMTCVGGGKVFFLAFFCGLAN